MSTDPATLDDPMAIIRSRYERFEGEPLNRLENAVRAGGMRTTSSTSRMAVREVVLDGMCIGTISKEGTDHVLEIMKRETTPEMIDGVRKSIEISRRNAFTHAQMAMRAGMGR